MRRTLIRTALILLALAPFPARPGGQTPEGGAINGRVKLTSRVRGVPLPANAYQPRTVNRRDAGSAPEIKSVVVYLKDAPYGGVLPVSHVAIRQEHEAFTPRVVAITRGSTVDFPNADPFFHNVFSLSGPANFDLGRYPQGKSRPRTFTKAGLVKVYCHIHSHMSATILVLDHPYFAVPDLDGSFTLANVPAGRYTIVGWHERVGEQSEPIQVEAGRAATIDLSLPVGDAP
jgi:plastocyanin